MFLTEFLSMVAEHGLRVPQHLSVVLVDWNEGIQVQIQDLEGLRKITPTYVQLNLKELVRRTLDLAEAWPERMEGMKRQRHEVEDPVRVFAPMVMKTGASTMSVSL